MKTQMVFGFDTDRAGNYRIPSLIATKRGTLIAAADARYFTASDNPNRIDKVIKRSCDNGASWEEEIVAVEEVGESKYKASAAIDAQLIYDAIEDKILMLYCHTPAGVGILNSRRSRGEDDNGRRIVRRGSSIFFLNENGVLMNRNGADSGYRSDEKGNVTKDTVRISNLFCGDGAFREDDTSYLMLTESRDDGVSWSKPVSLNRQVKSPKWGFIGPGPGIGIQLKHGAHAGRLVAPIYYNAVKWPLMLNALCIYSDDHGKTWSKSAVAGDLRHNPLKSSKFVLSYSGCTTESQIVERRDGSLFYIIRNHDKRREAMAATSLDQGDTFRDLRFLPDVTHPICQIAAISAEFNGRDAILVSHAEDRTKRRRGVVQMSLDGGITFPYTHVVTEDEFVYSTLCVLPNGKVGILYEPSTEHETIEFVSYDLNEIFNGAN